MASRRFIAAGAMAIMVVYTVVPSIYTQRPPVVKHQELPQEEPVGRWIEIDENATGIFERHEACFVTVGDRYAYLVGGRHWGPINIFDLVNRTWTAGRTPPIKLHHMQCVAAQGKLWIVAAWTGGFPREPNAPFVYVYDPAEDLWSTRTPLPLERRRGSSAVVVSEDETKIYVSHGGRGGHETADHAEDLPYLDVYDIASDSWTALSDDVPHPRGKNRSAVIIC